MINPVQKDSLLFASKGITLHSITDKQFSPFSGLFLQLSLNKCLIQCLFQKYWVSFYCFSRSFSLFIIRTGTSQFFTLNYETLKGTWTTWDIKKEGSIYDMVQPSQTHSNKSQLHRTVCLIGPVCKFLGTQQWPKAQKLFNHHQLRIFISKVTAEIWWLPEKAQVKIMKLWDHHRLCPAIHVSETLSGNGWFLLLQL